jgi:hypothetical protein
MTIKDHSMLQAVNLRVSWADHDTEALINQVTGVTTLQEARDLIIALTMTATLSNGTLRNMLSNSM